MKQIVSYTLLLCSLAGFLSTQHIQAQCPNPPPDPSWTITTCNAFSNHTINIFPTFVPGSFVNDIDGNGTTIDIGDYIGAFYTNDMGNLTCAGFEQWTGGNISFPVRGDDPAVTPLIDGFNTGDDLTMVWYIWDASTSTTIGPLEATFHPNNFFGFGLITNQNIYAVDGSSAIQSFFCLGNCPTTSACPPFLNLTGNLSNELYEAMDYITADNANVSSGDTVTFHANDYIELTQDFDVSINAQFTADIQPCGTTPVPRPVGTNVEAKAPITNE